MVNLATIYTAPYDTLRALLQTTVVDPQKNKANSPRRWIFRDIPDVTSHTFTGYPFIVLSHGDINDDRLIVLNNTWRENEMVFDIEVYTEFDDPKARNDYLSSEIVKLLLSTTAMTAMDCVGLFSPKIISSRTVPLAIAKKEIIVRTIRIGYTIDIGTC